MQVAAEKAKWPIRDEFRRMSSRQKRGQPIEARPAAAAPPPLRPVYEPIPNYQPAPSYTPPPLPPPAAAPSQGAQRFSSVFGRMR